MNYPRETFLPYNYTSTSISNPLPQPETEASRQKMNLSEPAEEYRYVMIYIFKMRHYRWNLRVTTVSAKRIWAHEIK